MRSNRPWPRVLGLSVLAALGMVAFTATSAQATSLPGLSTLGEFQINLAAALLATIHGTQANASRFLVPGRNLTIDCEKGLTVNGQIHHVAEVLTRLLFEGCVALNLEMTAKLPCTVLSTGEPTGSISFGTLGFPKLHGDGNYVLFEPREGELSFATIELHGATCPIPLLNPFKGSMSADVTLNDMVKPAFIFGTATQVLTGDALTFGGFPASLDLLLQVELKGTHAGMKLAVV